MRSFQKLFCWRRSRDDYSQHSGLVIVGDGTEEADQWIARVLWNDPASGEMRMRGVRKRRGMRGRWG